MVPRAGLEPARIAPHAPQTCAATNYATSARLDRPHGPSSVKKELYFFGVAEAFGLAVFAFAEFAFTAAVELELLAVFAA